MFNFEEKYSPPFCRQIYGLLHSRCLLNGQIMNYVREDGAIDNLVWLIGDQKMDIWDLFVEHLVFDGNQDKLKVFW